ncbi:sodium-translocating pyrophosphatase [Candidatus Woesearchaeota archaeon B3_Woes]|nr:MAG: sodium-translocating pyrophosphatase [Candidatus Woesearchaeota archaeon B3_Woes]
MDTTLITVIIISILALVFALVKYISISRKDQGDEKTKEIAKLIHDGAMAFLKKEYKLLSIFIMVFGVILYFIDTTPVNFQGEMTVCFLIGALFSAAAGNIGMRIATKANVRTAIASKKSLNDGLNIAFSSGTVMGMSVVGLGLLGVTGLYMWLGNPNIIFSFGFGASSIALFARVGGGIYTKAADVGADLVGKVEKNIPEDDPRNPATIADNVGDNVGDVAGMGADLFESYVDSIIAAMVLGILITSSIKNAVILPLVLAGVGIICSLIGVSFVKTKRKSGAASALNKGIFGAAGLMAILSPLIILKMTGSLNFYLATISGLGAGIAIGLSTEYYTSNERKPAKTIANASKTGPATNIITGISTGMISTIIPVLAVCVAMGLAFYFGMGVTNSAIGGMYGIAIAAVGMLSTLGITLATDSYGPVADNAAGIAEMAGLGKDVRKRTESLDAVGNTTAAIGKGFAIGSAALTALALFVTFSQVTGMEVINLMNHKVVIGLFIGGLLPFVFSALTMNAVGKAAEDMVIEVRRQFKTIKGLMQGKAKPNYKKCIDISTDAALKQMMLPSLIAIITPILIGLWSPEAVGGLIAGTLVTGFLLAVFMANAGGAWDNAKKYVEEGNLGGKGSEVHKAAVVGDTVGDPFKDTSGPSLNILIKLISIVALVFLPLFL